MISYQPFGKLLKKVVDNRGKTCPTLDHGLPLIATNCISNDHLYPQFIKVRYVDDDTYRNWFRGHPEPDDMIFVLKGSPGRVAWVPDPVNFCFAQDMVAIRADETKIYPKYLLAILRSKTIQYEIEGLHVGTLIPHFKKGDFDQLLIPVIELNLQRYIGDQYFNISKKIDLLQRQNRTLEALAQTLFRQWFIEEADDGWEVVTVGEYTQINKTSIKKDFPYASIEYLDTGSITEGKIDGYQNISFQEAPSRAKRIVEHNDVIISTVRPNQKHYGIIKNPKPNTIVSTGFCVLTCDKIDPHFIYILLTLPDMTEYLHVIAEASTSAYPSLKPSDIASIEFQLPPKQKLDEFSNLAHDMWAKIEHNDKQIRTLEKLRDTLLPKLMSGEVRVKH